MDDCAVINDLARVTPRISLHIPWDKADDSVALREKAQQLGISFDAVNSNTFQDQAGQKLSYKFGSLSHTDAAVRSQAIEHNLECIEFGEKIGSKGLAIWIGDGSNFPGQQHIGRAFERYLASTGEIYKNIAADWTLFIEHKFYEPAFYSTVIPDWGTSYLAAMTLGARAKCLVDLGHHAASTNIEMVVTRLLVAGKLGGFHFNDCNYGDDDLDSGSTNPYRLFLIFNELVDAQRQNKLPSMSYMIDQSHNVTDPIESMMQSAIDIQRAYIQAHLVDRERLWQAQEDNDALVASLILKEGFLTDVSPILAMARKRNGGAIAPLACFRASGYRSKVAKERPDQSGVGGGIV